MATTNPSKRTTPYSLEDKLKLCQTWQQTNLSRNKFIKQNGLPSSFHEWCNTLLPKAMAINENGAVESNPEPWLEVVSGGADALNKQQEPLSELIDFKVTCNDLIFNFCMPINKAIIFIRSLSNATTAIR